MKTFYTTSKKYVLLTLLSMSLVLQSCGNGEVSPNTASTMQGIVKSGFLQEKGLAIDTDRSHEHTSMTKEGYASDQLHIGY